jgi:hypothetical protein
MKFSLAFLSAAFAIASAQEKKHFHRDFSSALSFGSGVSGGIVSGDPNHYTCRHIFEACYVIAYDQIYDGADTQAETVSVSSVDPAFALSVGTQGGKYVYNSNGDYSCRRCLRSAGLVGSEEDMLKGDEEVDEALAACLKATNEECFGGLDSVVTTYSTSPPVTEQRLEQEKTHFKRDIATSLSFDDAAGVAATSPKDETCKHVFEACYVISYDQINEGADTQAETLTVKSWSPGFSLRSMVKGGKYVYNSNGDYSCRRCLRSAGFVGSEEDMLKGDEEVDEALATCLKATSKECFGALDSVKTTYSAVEFVANAE